MSLEEKSQMLLAMKTVDGDGEPAKRIKIELDTLQEKSLHHFVTKNTMSFFQKLNLKTDSLELPVEQWHSNLNFQEAKATVQALSVVNDHAERGSSLDPRIFWEDNRR